MRCFDFKQFDETSNSFFANLYNRQKFARQTFVSNVSRQTFDRVSNI